LQVTNEAPDRTLGSSRQKTKHHKIKSICERKIMSNHAGSYLINDILKILEKESIFDILGKEKTQNLILEILGAAHQYDCNPGELLQDIGEKIGICYYCQSIAEEFHDEICNVCHERYFG